MFDCVIVGGGPAGLTAAIYLARFHLTVRLYDSESSRAALISRTHNHAGFPGGIGGLELLERMRVQAREFGVERHVATVTSIIPFGRNFTVTTATDTVRARTILLATGVENLRPAMPTAEHDVALARGLLRYCPICDGFEVTDKRVGVIGTGNHGMEEALFLRGFSRHITLIAPGAAHELDTKCRAKLDRGNIPHLDGPCTPIRIDGDELIVTSAVGERRFDTVYPALGSRIRSELAVAAGASASQDGCVHVDAHQRTSVAGIFAAGDVVLGLDQISHAMGQAGVAATAIRNLLDRQAPLRR